MRLTGGGLTMRNAGEEDHDAIVGLLEQWPHNRVRRPAIQAKRMVAQNANFEHILTDASGFMANRVGVLDGRVVSLEVVQFIGRTCFVRNHLVAESARQSNVYDRMSKIGQFMLFERMGATGCLFEVPEWSEAVRQRAERDGFTVFRREERNGIDVLICGYDAKHYREVLKRKIHFAIRSAGGGNG